MKHRRILALAAVILLFLLYGSSVVFACLKSPLAESLLTASLFCTVVIPAVLYGYAVVLKYWSHRDKKD